MAGLWWPVRPAAGALRAWGPRGPHRGKTVQAPRRPLPRTPWTTRGPPPGAPLPRSWQDKRPVQEQIPGLEQVTYADKQHFVPWLARPRHPRWERGWHDPRHSPGLRYEAMPLYKERVCYVCHQRTKMLEGVRQALWLTKTKIMEGLPPKVLSIIDEPANQLENQDERVQNAISHARLWNTTELIPKRESYCPVLLEDLLHLCRTMASKYPSLSKRMLARDYKVAAIWERESSMLQVRGMNGILLNAINPLLPVASKDEILATENQILETFHPISPTIDLQEVNVYEERNDTGFREGYPYPHPHTLYFVESANIRPTRFRPEQLRAKMLMFAFGNALAKAKMLYGDDPKVLEHPVVVQSIGTEGRIFQFMVFQLNTTDLASSDGVKNLVWIDSDQYMYDYIRYLPGIRKKVVKFPPGIYGYRPDTFKKFLALYLHGAVQDSTQNKIL
ncbi:heterogeneous nuclear ribonucleoprotein A0 [Platysternon megacephalum]|uniref:Large ribosomal subunit protein mL37 n=1 Tax=Platysternon megacephalum TaxID=55544 RepID=A0A4D9EIV8_9SAUR|nr:heterogeneous nuclear ribonucleoprotein A0 [Platysternon megacephalum]